MLAPSLTNSFVNPPVPFTQALGLDLYFDGSTQDVNRDLGQLSTVIENLQTFSLWQ